jgi:cysteine desulfurase
MNKRKIYYLDNNATTRVAPEAVEAMIPFMRDEWGNPSSIYSFGKRVAKQVENAREKVGTLIHSEPGEIIFTSCGTEGNNSALQSALVMQPSRRHVLTTAVEHAANLRFCEFLRTRGYEVTLLPVDSDGNLDLQLLERSIRPETAIVSVMWANNETGVIFPIKEIAAICAAKGVLFHSDAVQAAGRLKIDVKDSGVDFLSLSAHKLHGPKGVGALYVKRKTRYQPFISGGGQERGRRGGTENVTGIVGFGCAAELASSRLRDANTRIRALRDRLEDGISRRIPGTVRNGAKGRRLPNTTNLSFESVEAEGILLLLDQLGICVSSGSACTSGSLDPSHVLLAMGCSVSRARASIRFSLSFYNIGAEVDYVLKHLPAVVAKLRANLPVADTGPDRSSVSQRRIRSTQVARTAR